jgi:hypothetical protein
VRRRRGGGGSGDGADDGDGGDDEAGWQVRLDGGHLCVGKDLGKLGNATLNVGRSAEEAYSLLAG